MPLIQKLLLLSSSLLAFVSCRPFEKIEIPEKRLIVVYMVADNNLDYFSLLDIKEMEMGFPKNANNTLVVYLDRGQNGRPSHPYILEITHDETDEIVSPVILSFPEQNSTDAKIFASVWEEILQHYKHQNFTSKGLVLWSHGNAWLPNGVSILTDRDKITKEIKSFGLDKVPQDANMDIKELARELKGYDLDFILFDACFMASIEVIYELRNVTDCIIASSTEILSSGFPYQEVVPLFFEKNLDFYNIAKKYFQYYNDKSGILKSASVSVFKTNEMDDLVKQIYDFSSSLASKPKFFIHREEVQQLDRHNGNWVYDLKDFLEKTAYRNDLVGEYDKIVKQWHKAVIYENNTPFMLEDIDLKHSHGISTYIPDASHEEEINTYYKTLSWFQASGYEKIFTRF